MAANRPTDSRALQAIRRVALTYPEVEEGTVCNKVAFKARKKSFVFVGSDETAYDVKLKLADSLDEAATLAADEPEHYRVGGHGWVELTFDHGDSPPAGLLARWIDGSFRLLVPRKLVALLPKDGPPATSPNL